MTKLLTAKELSQLLRIPKRSIYKFAKEGYIPGTLRIGKHWRFRQDVMEKWILQQTEIQTKSISENKAIFTKK